YSEWPQVILDQPALAKVPALTESERIHLLALEASLAVIDRVRATELAHAGIDPEDPLLERLQRLEEEAVALFIAHSLEENETTGVSQPECEIDRTVTESAPEPKHIQCDRKEPGDAAIGLPDGFSESVLRSLLAAAGDFSLSTDNPIKSIERYFDRLAGLQPGVSLAKTPAGEAERRRLQGFLYKAFILESERFLDVDDDEIRHAIDFVGGNAENLFLCKLRLLLLELRESRADAPSLPDAFGSPR
ncbi:MAG: hypothetical protein ACREAC_23450, partial [Blastocatellia bacterium]